MTPLLDTPVHPDHAAAACCILIRAYAAAPEHVDWSDIQDALAQALAAYGLDQDDLDAASGSTASREDAP